MFKKLKQRIEEGEQQQPPSKICSSTPKKNISLKSSAPRNRNGVGKVTNNAPSTGNNRSIGKAAHKPASKFISSSKQNGVHNGLKVENKWEKRRMNSAASLHSSRESLFSVDSVATTGTSVTAFSRISFGGASSCSTEGAPTIESPLVETLRDGGTKEEILSELAKKNEEVKKMEIKVSELQHAFIEESKQRDRLEEALENIRNEMINRAESSNENHETLLAVKEEYEQKLLIKEQQLKEYKNKHQESIISHAEMSKKTAELITKTMKIENIEKEYREQKLEFETLQRTLNELSKDRSQYEMQIKQLTMQVTTLEREKSQLKCELSNIIDELTQKSSMLETLQSSADKAHQEALSIQQTYNLYKAKASSDINEREAEISMWKDKIHDLHQKLEGSKLSENDQIKVLERENHHLEKKLQESREQVTDIRTQSNDNVSSLNALVSDLEKRLDEANKNSKNFATENHFTETLRGKVRDLEQKCLTLKTEKMELEIVADKASFLESQNNLLDTRFKETVERLEADRSNLEEKVRELQKDSRKSSYRQDHTNRRKMEQLETKVEDQDRIIAQYQERLEELVMEKDSTITELDRKDEESKKASRCLEEAMVSTNELKKEISKLEEALREKDDLIKYIKETRDERFSSREKDLIQRDEEIEELQRVLQDRDDELAAVSERFHKLQENMRMPLSKSYGSSNETELQKTVLRLTDKIHVLEEQIASTENMEIEKRTLKAELDEANKKIRTLQQNLSDLKKHCQKESKSVQMQSPGNSDKDINDFDNGARWKKEKDKQDYLDVNFKYLKHVILKYMCGSNDQSRQLVGVIGHLLQFTPRESSIVRDCFEWKLPIEK